ncbi:glutamyl-tRNA reductase [Caldivirga maquilingensis]|uniref:Glutamyl-tRNA reductase n=1 Tax=Caldivirga maquilingensis (strain ATCC 700844 / DSM 13496 / JCM 10307 / IC-167) TaxID=397948 RepID=HEM1_CALMQ|nr:glutamyl-tRNA reductase [Caldivirga maquilingensis]A8MAH6.1 RecName: Full=Glutamyl-tRNA reductase; Short=GluTR [Caldivirga maquilingensis IC-167]ABW02553.1 Glutamyl-tRNA reductase [Caldivirga maquilingensis IC-167]
MGIDDYLSKIRALTLNHKRVSTITLSETYFNRDEVYGKLMNYYDEVFLLQTCNRVEVYVYGDDDSVAEDMYKVKGTINHVDKLVGMNAVRHIFRVAAGLESAAVGESEILGQVEDAFNDARKRGALGGLLGFTIERAIRTGKEIRSRFPEISIGLASIGSLVAEYVHRVRGLNSRIAVIGAGSIGSDIVRRLAEKGFRNVIIVNRTLDKAKAAALRYGFNYAPIDSLRSVIRDSDVVIFATSATNPLLRRRDAEELSGKPIIIDVGVPRNVDPEIPGVVSIDELKNIENEIREGKRKALDEASRLIELRLIEYRRLFARRVIEGMIGELTKWGLSIGESEVKRAVKAGLIKNEEDGAALAVKSTVKKIMLPLLTYLKELAEEDKFDEALIIISGIKAKLNGDGKQS